MDRIKSIKDHEKILKSMKKCFNKKNLLFLELHGEIKQLETKIKLLEFQIENAKKTNKLSFDAGIYKVREFK